MNAIVAYIADALVYGPGYSFTAHAPNGTVMNWHEAAQATLRPPGFSVPNASLIYSIAAVLFCWLLLWMLWRKKVFLKI